MKWVSNGGYGHAVIETTDEGHVAACGRTLSLEAEGVETGSLQERPYGIDTCQTCHTTVKGYQLGTAPVPEGLFAVPAANSPKAKITPAQRAAAIRGETAPVPDNAGDTGTEAGSAPAVKDAPAPEPGSDEDLGFEPAGPTGTLKSSGGAVVVVPDRPRRARRRAAEASDLPDIDSE